MKACRSPWPPPRRPWGSKVLGRLTPGRGDFLWFPDFFFFFSGGLVRIRVLKTKTWLGLLFDFLVIPHKQMFKQTAKNRRHPHLHLIFLLLSFAVSYLLYVLIVGKNVYKKNAMSELWGRQAGRWWRPVAFPLSVLFCLFVWVDLHLSVCHGFCGRASDRPIAPCISCHRLQTWCSNSVLQALSRIVLILVFPICAQTFSLVSNVVSTWCWLSLFHQLPISQSLGLQVTVVTPCNPLAGTLIFGILSVTVHVSFAQNTQSKVPLQVLPFIIHLSLS